MTHKFKVLVSFVRHYLSPYGPLNKVMCFFEVNFAGFFRKDFITEDFLDIHEKPFEKAKQERKGCFVLLEFVNAQWYSNWKYTT